MKKLKEASVENKRVLVRCDFNCPLDEKGNILNDFRIKESIPTIEYLIKKRAKVILMSHLGRPGGKVVESLRLNKIQEKLLEYLDLSVVKAKDCIGKEVEDWIGQMLPGEVLLLENLRFHKEEEEGDLNFAKELAKLADIYVNDAFACCHRAHASISQVPKFLPNVTGLLLEKEIKGLNRIIKNPKKPLVAIFGGREADFEVINKISEKADWILIGGLIQKEIKEKDIKLTHPKKIIKPIDAVDGGEDIGSKTINLFKEKISQAKTIFWSGPFGKIEEKRFSKGTEEIAKAIIESGAFSVIGGGATIDFIDDLGLSQKFNHLSTGGSAMLEFLAGKKLPGLEALE